MLKNKLKRSSAAGFETEDVNPMDGVGNLADAMLVLAVGIMVALVSAFDVDIQGEALADTDGMQQVEDYGEITEDLTGESADDMGLSEVGKVYRDAEGNLYVLED